MELKQIKELMAAMERTQTKKLSLKKDDFELQLERGASEPTHYFEDEEEEENAPRIQIKKRSNLPLPRTGDMAQALHAEESLQAGTFITSPMVGTFYSSPSPEDPAFVKPGDQVEKNSVVCIIEAMKVMNEIKAGISGTIAEVLVENGHPVEFGTKLYRVN